MEQFAKLLKEATENFENSTSMETKTSEPLEPELKPKRFRKSKFDLIEERFWILLVMTLALVYIFLLVTGQSAVLEHEKTIFNESRIKINQTIMSKLGISTDTASQDIPLELLQAQADYDKFAACKEFQVNWSVFEEEQENAASNNQEAAIRSIVKAMNDQYARIAVLESKAPESIESTEIEDYETTSFEGFARQFSRNPNNNTYNKNEKSVLNHLDSIYSRIIQNHFIRQLDGINERLFQEPLFLAKQQELLFAALSDTLSAKMTAPKEHKKTHDALIAEINKILKQKRESIEKYMANTAQALSNLLVEIESVPNYPIPPIKSETPIQKTIVENAHIKFFNHLYSTLNNNTIKN